MAVVRSFVKTVTTAGTEVQLSTTDLWVKQVIIRPLAANTGNVFIGNTGAGVVGIANGLPMEPADNPLVIGNVTGANGGDDMINLKDIWLDTSVNNEGVGVLYIV